MSRILLRRVENYLRKTRTAATTFGREALRDPQFVFELRRGRRPRQRTVVRVNAFIDAREQMMEAVRCGRR